MCSLVANLPALGAEEWNYRFPKFKIQRIAAELTSVLN